MDSSKRCSSVISPGEANRVHTFAGNTSLTRLIWSWDRPRLAAFNDLAHFGPRPTVVSEHLDKGEPVLALVRHGQTRANTEGRWQGQGDWGLDELGHRQARALRDWYGTASTVYASPLGRALSTAQYVASNGITTLDGLKELDMGKWEGLTSDEIYETWPDLMGTIYRDGVDLKRGESGESWGELTGRIRDTVPASSPPSTSRPWWWLMAAPSGPMSPPSGDHRFALGVALHPRQHRRHSRRPHRQRPASPRLRGFRPSREPLLASLRCPGTTPAAMRWSIDGIPPTCVASTGCYRSVPGSGCSRSDADRGT